MNKLRKFLVDVKNLLPAKNKDKIEKNMKEGKKVVKAEETNKKR